MSVLIVAEHETQALKETTYHAVTAALSLHSEIDLLIVGYRCEALAKIAAGLPSIRKVMIADEAVYENQLAENVSLLLESLAKNYTHVLATSSTFSKNIFPRLAALLNVNMISDVLSIQSPDIFVRGLFAGNILETVQSEDPIKILTIRGTAFKAVTLGHSTNTAAIQKLDSVIPNQTSRFVSHALTVSKRPELTAARIILSGGRGFKSAENFKLLEGLADRLHAAIGASRAAVDAGFAPNDYQIGQTGKMVAPDLYMAFGISGAIQHVAGMKDSKVIVAINQDPEAPIFEVSDYVLVGDLFQILKELEAAFDKQNENYPL